MISLNRRGWVVKNHRKRNSCEREEAKEKLTYLNEWTLSRRQSSVARKDVKTSGERPYLLLYRILQAGHIAEFSPYLKEAQNY